MNKPKPLYNSLRVNCFTVVLQGRATNIISLDLLKVLDTVLYDFLVPKLERHGSDG